MPQGDLAQEMTKDPYNFDFLTMTEGYNEKELKDALENNIVKFLLELGSGFAFVGREYRLVIGETEKFMVKVVNIEYFAEADAPFPVNKTKHIIRKCTDDDIERFLPL